MTLAKVLARKAIVVLGVNSGTSADGIDLAALRFSSSLSQPIKFLSGTTRPYPVEVRDCVLHVSHSRDIQMDTLVYLDNLLGQLYGQASAEFIGRLAKTGIAVDVVASHGQTVRHLPSKTKFLGYSMHGTLQLGSLERIAALTNRVVVGDFRQGDVAIGNEGAPITVAAMARLFGDARQSRLLVNIGGMANYFYFPAGADIAQTRAADTGPGNSLSDLLSRRLYGETYDRSGRHASRGTVSRKLLRVVLRDPFFARKTTSTGREAFGEVMIEKLLSAARHSRVSGDDVLATVVEATVEGIVRKVQPLLRKDAKLDKLYLTGGGLHNSFLLKRLREVLAPCRVVSITELGFDPDLVEASAYATMGYACLRSEPLPTVFRKAGRQRIVPILGKIVQPPKQRK